MTSTLSRTLALVGSVLLVSLGTPQPAQAAGSPNLGLTLDAPGQVLLGAPATVNLTAANPAGQPYGYNLSFRDVLPAGLSYVAGSGSYEGQGVGPQVIVANAGTTTETTTLIWRNVGDLSPGSTGALTYKVRHATTGVNAYTVGGTRGSYQHQAAAYVNSDARTVPAFTSAGVPTGGSTGSDAKSATTQITAISIDVQESSPEAELLRGAHDHQTVYTLHLENNTSNPTGPLTVEAFLPAGLEFLRCGASDNSTSAATNPGSSEEWPGAGPLSGNRAAPAGCDTPSEVATVTVDPDGAGGLPSAVYTRVRWTGLGSLGASGSRDLRYVAAVPLRANTTTWTQATPTAASLGQAANLDNNGGARTQDEQALPTYATVSGLYNGTTAVSAGDTETRYAEDLRVLKSASQPTIADGQETRWSLALATGEYRYVDNLRVTDTVPDGLCPLDTTNRESDTTGDCDPGGAGTPPSHPYSAISENANGSWTLNWNSSTDPALDRMQPSSTHTIAFSTRARPNYQQSGVDERPVLARDTWTNTVSVLGSDHQRCSNGPDCETPPPVRLDPTPGLPADSDVDATDDADASSAAQSAGAPSLDTTIRTAGGAVPANCSGGTYTDGPEGPFGPGDRICFKLRVDFPSTLDTGTPKVHDFLPAGVTYESHVVTGNNTVAVANFAGTAGDSVVTWTLGSGSSTAVNGQVFEVLVAGRLTNPNAGQSADVKGNLMKLEHVNTTGQSFPLRDEANFTWTEPQLELTEGVRDIDDSPAGGNGPNVDGGTVQAGDVVTIRVDARNAGTRDAANATIWERLPSTTPAVDCAAVSAISDGGGCAGGVIAWNALALAAGASKTLTYDYVVPAGARPATTFSHRAGVRSYESADNAAGSFTYYPANNVDASVTASTANTTAASDTTSVSTGSPTAGLTRSTSVGGESGNATADQATIGEQITYTGSVSIPAGTTLVGGARYRIRLGNRQSYVAGSLNPTSLPAGVTANYDDTSNPTSPAVVLDFPDGYTNAAGSGADVATVTFATTVDDEAANSRVAGDITATGTLTYTNGANVLATATPSVSTAIVEPLISLTKDENDADDRVEPAQRLRYTLTLANSSLGRVSAAHDTTVVDTLPGGLTPVDGAGSPVADGTTVSPGTGVWNSAARTITFTRAAGLAPGASTPFAYDVRADDPQLGNANKVNSAVAFTTSHPTGTPPASERVGTLAAAPASPAGYRTTATDTVRVAGAALTKAVDASTAAVGESRTFTLDVAIPAGLELYDVTVRDLLPDGLDYEPGSFAASCVGSCGLSATALSPTANGDGSTQLGFFLGDVSSAATSRVVRITYSAHVDDRREPEGTSIGRGATLTNVAAVHSNQSNAISGTPSAVPDPSAFSDAGPAQSTTVTVIEPTLTVDKDVSGQAADSDTRTAQPGESLTYTVAVTNTGNATAHDVVVTDQPDAELVGVAPAAGQSTTALTDGWTAADPDLRWELASIPAAQTVTFTYTAGLASSSGLHEVDQAVNTGDVPAYFARPWAERTANGFDYRSYGTGASDVTADVVTVGIDLPRIEVDLTTGRAGSPESADAEVGQDFRWRAVVRNTSPSADARDADLTVRLPRNWSYTAGSAAGGGEPTVTPDAAHGDELTWSDFADLTPGASSVVTFDAKPGVAARTDAGTGAGNPHVARAHLTADDASGASASADGSYADGPDEADAVLLAPELAISKTPDNGTATAGTAAAWTVRVDNTGTGTARGVRVTDTLPAGVTYTAGAASSGAAGFAETANTSHPDGSRTVAWTLADLAPGTGATITVPVAVPADADAPSSRVNSATVRADEQPSGPTDTGGFDLNTRADLGVVASTTLAAQNAGGTVDFTLVVTNHGPSDARGSTLADALPPGLTFTSFLQGDAECDERANAIACDFGTLAPGATRTVVVRARIGSDQTGSLTNTASVATSTTDPVPANDADDAQVTVGEQADLRVTKEVTASAVRLGGRASFTVDVDNLGPSDARNVSVTDTLPAGMTLVSLSAPNATCSTATASCALGTVPAGAGRRMTVVARADSLGLKSNVAAATTSAADPDPANDSDDATFAVGPAADLGVEKSGPATVAAGDTGEFRLAVVNHGPSDATGVTVTDTLPAGLTLVSATTQRGTCEPTDQVAACRIGSVARGETVEVTVVARAEHAAAEQTLVNTAGVAGDQVDPEPDNDSDTHPVTIGKAADLSLAKDAPARVPAGGRLLYTLQIGNAGRSDATGVVVSDPLPDGLRLASAQSSQGTCASENGVVTCDVGTVVAGGAAQILIAADVGELTGRTVRNEATVTGALPDPDAGDRTDAAETVVDAPAKVAGAMAVTKRADSGSDAQLGQPVPYTIKIRNDGARTANDVVAVDRPSGPVDVVSIDAERGTCNRDTLRCDIGTMQPGETVTVRVVMTPEEAGRLRNSVTVRSDQGEQDERDNVGVAGVAVGTRTTAFRLSKRASRRVVRAGSRLRYSLRATNTGRHAAAGVRICDKPGRGLSFVRIKGAKLSRGRACWTVGFWKAGQTRSFSVIARVDRTRTGSVANGATLSAGNARTLRRDATVRVTGRGSRRGGGVTG